MSEDSTDNGGRGLEGSIFSTISRWYEKLIDTCSHLGAGGFLDSIQLDSESVKSLIKTSFESIKTFGTEVLRPYKRFKNLLVEIYGHTQVMLGKVKGEILIIAILQSVSLLICILLGENSTPAIWVQGVLIITLLITSSISDMPLKDVYATCASGAFGILYSLSDRLSDSNNGKITDQEKQLEYELQRVVDLENEKKTLTEQNQLAREAHEADDIRIGQIYEAPNKNQHDLLQSQYDALKSSHDIITDKHSILISDFEQLKRENEDLKLRHNSLQNSTELIPDSDVSNDLVLQQIQEQLYQLPQVEATKNIMSLLHQMNSTSQRLENSRLEPSVVGDGSIDGWLYLNQSTVVTGFTALATTFIVLMFIRWFLNGRYISRGQYKYD